MPNKIEIIANACLLLGATPISDLSEGTEGVTANALYETCYNGLLASHSWRFASRVEDLVKVDTIPNNGWQYEFQLPTDYITVYKELSNSQYDIYQDKLYSNNSEVSVEIRFRVDEMLLPAHYLLALQYFLAFNFAIPITEDINKSNLYYRSYINQVQKAKTIDSQSKPNIGFGEQAFNKSWRS